MSDKRVRKLIAKIESMDDGSEGCPWDQDELDLILESLRCREQEPVARVVFDLKYQGDNLISKSRPQIFKAQSDDKLMQLEQDTNLYTAPVSQPDTVSVPTEEMIAAGAKALQEPPIAATDTVQRYVDAYRCYEAMLSAAPRRPEARPKATVVPDVPSMSFQLQSGKHVVAFEYWLAVQQIAKWLESRAEQPASGRSIVHARGIAQRGELDSRCYCCRPEKP